MNLDLGVFFFIAVMTFGFCSLIKDFIGWLYYRRFRNNKSPWETAPSYLKECYRKENDSGGEA